MTNQHGSCHCGAVEFEFAGDVSKASRCNCSICSKTMWTAVIGKPEQLKVVRGEDELASYEWGHKISTRFFCKHCGVMCFSRGYLAEVGGDYVSINVSTIDGVDPHTIPLIYWDGRHNNWESGPRPQPWPM